MKHKLAFIGPQVIHNAFKDMNEDWDMQIPLATLKDYDDELMADDNVSRISKSTNVVIFFSRLFQTDPELFAELVAYSAPYSVVCILIPTSEMPRDERKISNAIKNAQIIEQQTHNNYNTNTPFYFVKYEDAEVDIYNAIRDYCRSPVIDQETKDEIRLMLDDDNHILVEDELENVLMDSDEDKVVIPKAAPNAKGKVIAVTSSKGGSGKSTVSVSLGAYIAQASLDGYNKGLSQAPLKVCIIDLDVRDGQLGFLNGVNSPNIIDIISEGAPTEQNIRNGIYHSQKSGVDYIFAAKRPRNAKEVPASFYAELIQNLRTMYDYIILDTSVNYLDPLLEEVAYPIADKIIFVTDMGISSIYGMARWINETIISTDQEVEIDKNKVGIVVNKAMNDINMTPEKIEKSSKGIPIIGVVPSSPSLITYSANTNELQNILKSKAINESFKWIVETVIEEEHIPQLGIVPTF